MIIDKNWQIIMHNADMHNADFDYPEKKPKQTLIDDTHFAADKVLA